MHTYVFYSWPSSSAQETSVILYFALCSGPIFYPPEPPAGSRPILVNTHPSWPQQPDRESRKTDRSASAEAHQDPLMILLGAP